MLFFEESNIDLANTLQNLSSIEVTVLQTKQSPYTMPDYGTDNPYKALKDDSLRKAQKSLYKEGLFETPLEVKEKLDSYSIAIWQSDEARIWGVSNRFDTVIFKPDASIKIDFSNIRPAKGAGGSYLVVGDLYISDKPNSAELLQVVKRLEKITKKSIDCYEGYDC